MRHLVRKNGIPVLVYSQGDSTSPLLLSLVIKCNDLLTQATVCLQSSLRIRGFNDAQSFILQYDVDNFAPGSSSIGPAAINLDQTRLKKVARHGNPQIRTLFLTFKTPCAVWFPTTDGPLVPQDDSKGIFQELGQLAQATRVNILFDHNWLHRDTHATSQRMIKHPETFSAFPVSTHYGKHSRCGSWTDFHLVDSDVQAGAEAPSEDPEPPPPYFESHKRSRQGTFTHPSSHSRNSKRVPLSPFFEHVPTSPTEKNTLSPKQHISPEGAKGPGISTPSLQAVIEQTLSALLPSTIEALLPKVLPQVLTTAHANYLRQIADVEFDEAQEEHRLQLCMEKDDVIADVERVVDGKLAELKERADAVMHDATEHLDALEYEKRKLQSERKDLEREKGELRKGKSLLAWEQENLRHEREKFERHVGKANPLARGTRAGSAPV
ncbi:hypothetical protein M011DRAFT_413187 [Sporormia fimetaria CBS 119925]|uniref:Uncharacterized protein n=1 Tax=Sporormia fimetaria CBS 119925 TaxID=1340428 RepID=A0A6A6UX85_9PLEO|nr:hypothetical protein M011DRAFT_413187 [Sporormia fimetaria CBS 119925]